MNQGKLDLVKQEMARVNIDILGISELNWMEMGETESESCSVVSNPLQPHGKSGGQSLIAPERMKRLGQSRNDGQLWMCLVVKVKSNAVKNNISYEPGMLGP